MSFVEHFVVQLVTFSFIISINFKSNKSKSPWSSWLLISHNCYIYNFSKWFHVAFYVMFSCWIKNSTNKVLHKMWLIRRPWLFLSLSLWNILQTSLELGKQICNLIDIRLGWLRLNIWIIVLLNERLLMRWNLLLETVIALISHILLLWHMTPLLLSIWRLIVNQGCARMRHWWLMLLRHEIALNLS